MNNKNQNTGITLVDVRSEAMETIKALREGSIDVKQAQAIKDLLNTVIDTAKTQVEFLKSIPNSVKEQMKSEEIKAIAGTLKDRNAELEITLHEIEKNKNKINIK